jgi:hypothetical protein
MRSARTPRRRDDFLDLHSRHSQQIFFAIDLVAISKKEARSGLVRESLDDLWLTWSGFRIPTYARAELLSLVFLDLDHLS